MKNGKQWTKNANTKQNCGAVTTAITTSRDGAIFSGESLLQELGPVSRKPRKLFGPEKP